jgi:hypothetical protein
VGCQRRALGDQRSEHGGHDLSRPGGARRYDAEVWGLVRENSPRRVSGEQKACSAQVGYDALLGVTAEQTSAKGLSGLSAGVAIGKGLSQSSTTLTGGPGRLLESGLRADVCTVCCRPCARDVVVRRIWHLLQHGLAVGRRLLGAEKICETLAQETRTNNAGGLSG